MNKDKKLAVANLILVFMTVFCAVLLLGMLSWGLWNRPLATVGIVAGTSAIGAFLWALLYSYEHS